MSPFCPPVPHTLALVHPRRRHEQRDEGGGPFSPKDIKEKNIPDRSNNRFTDPKELERFEEQLGGQC